MLRNERSETYVEIRNTITLIKKGQINDLAFFDGFKFEFYRDINISSRCFCIQNQSCQLNNSFKLTDLKKTIIRDTNIPINMAPIVIKLRLGLDLDKGTWAGSNTLKMGVSF